MRTQSEKAAAFRDLHTRPGAFVIPNPWDAGTARLLASLGYEALATTSGGLAFSLGRPDGRGAVTREESLASAAAIVAATDLPVSGDLENGFGDTPEAVAATILAAAETGLVGGSIEDATGDPRRPIYDFNLAVERVAAAVQVAKALQFPFTLTARAENFLHGRLDFDDTLRRLQAFEAAGADVLFAPGLPGLAALRTVCALLKKPVNAIVVPREEALSVDALAAAGVKRISVGSGLSRVALGAFLESAREMKQAGTFDSLRQGIPYATLNKLLSNPESES